MAQQMSRQELLDFMEQNWAVYLATLDALPDDQLQEFAEGEGYPDAKALLAHIAAWWRDGVRNLRAISAGQTPTASYRTEDEFNARVIQSSDNQTYEQVEEDFENAREEIAGLVAELPEETLAQPQVYDLVYSAVVTHYQQHVPPGDPQIPAARYGGEHSA